MLAAIGTKGGAFPKTTQTRFQLISRVMRLLLNPLYEIVLVLKTLNSEIFIEDLNLP